jgi:hypothetical protein
MCILYKGKPTGLAVLQYTDPDDKGLSFEGVGVFTDGELHNGPFVCINGNGWGHSFSLMTNGRPADNQFYTYFFRDGFTENVDSLEKETDVSG